ncbi:type II secretion system protein N [Allohahella marinimesophila]|uniref:Type II secretion system protein GspC N-terminal domain-containing protein n=1 Tax=Allohahella marinimesophila TaxID=1054972 RepID=A0ABP7QA18_9GAMM
MPSRLQQWLPWLLTTIIVVCAAVYLTSHSLALWRDYQQLKRPPVAVSAQSGNAVVQRPVRQLLGLNLFGSPTASAPAPVQTTEELPETNLQLTLRGISSSGETDVGGALIEGPDRITDFFRVGESMPGNASLHSVYANRVVIDRSGQLENLFFPEELGSGSNVEAYSPSNDSYNQTYEQDYQDSGYDQSGDVPVYQPEVQELNEYAPEVTPDEGSAIPGEQFDAAGYEPPEGIPAEPVPATEAVSELEEARRAEIRDRLQKMRETIRSQAQ